MSAAQLIDHVMASAPPQPEADAWLREDPRWQLAQRVAESPSFASAPLLARFLLFACERTLTSRTDELTERNIGVIVFHRRPDFKTSEDNIVRTYARQLRQRLERYFDEQEPDAPLRIAVPRGGYCAVFEPRVSADESALAAGTAIEAATTAAAVSVPVSADQPSAPPAVRPLVLWIAAAVVAVALLVMGLRGYLAHRAAAAQPGHALWAELFTPSANTTIVSADSGLVVLEELSGNIATLEQYGDGSYFAQFDQAGTEEQRKLQRLSRERYTGLPDIETAVALTSLPEAREGHVQLRNARALHLEDLKDGNVIFMGSSYSTPWVALYEPKLNFRFRFDQTIYSSAFVNVHPQPGEQPIYRNSSTDLPFETYADIAYLPTLDGSGKALLIAGLTTAGTEAASELLLHGDIDAFLKTVPRDAHGLRPFELLVKTTSISSNASSVEIVAKRYY